MEEEQRADNVERKLRTVLEAVYATFLTGERGVTSFEILCRQMIKAVDDFPIPSSHGRRRQVLLGTYFEAAMRARRQAGRPRTVDPHMLIFVWMTLHQSRKVQQGPFDSGARTPAAEIAAECARRGYPAFTPEQVRNAIKNMRRRQA